MPKNFWSSDHIAYQNSYTTPTSVPIWQQSGYVHDSSMGNRGDSKYNWRTHAYPSRTTDVRSRAELYPDPDHFDSVRQRTSWFRSEEGRTYSGRGRAAQPSKPPAKFSTHREIQKPGYSWHGRKYSDSELGPCEPDISEKGAGEKDFHLAKKQTLNKLDSKTQEIQRSGIGQSQYRAEEVREKRFSEERIPIDSSIPREIGNENEVIAGYYDEATKLRSTERRGPEKSVYPDKKVYEEVLDKVETEKLPAERVDIMEIRDSPLKSDRNLQQPRFENVSPVLGQSDEAMGYVKGAGTAVVAAALQIEPTTTDSRRESIENIEVTESMKEESVVTEETVQGGVLLLALMCVLPFLTVYKLSFTVYRK